MKFKKFIGLFGMFLLVISLFPLVASEEVVEIKTFGEEIVDAYRLYELLNQQGIPLDSILVEGVQFYESSDFLDVYFLTESLLPNELGILSNIQPASVSNHTSYVKINLSNNEITEGDFSIYSADQFIFGNNKVYVPDNSRVIFKNGIVDLKVGAGSNFEQLPEILDVGKFSSKIRVEGEGITFPDGIELVEGKVDLSANGFEVLEGDFNYKGNLISVGEDFEQVLVTTNDLEDYAGIG